VFLLLPVERARDREPRSRVEHHAGTREQARRRGSIYHGTTRLLTRNSTVLVPWCKTPVRLQR
jgi:hypothetical protein